MTRPIPKRLPVDAADRLARVLARLLSEKLEERRHIERLRGEER